MANVYSGDECPKCGAPIVCGYGLAGGGIGTYTYCENEKCDYFDKVQDADEAPPPPEKKP